MLPDLKNVIVQRSPHEFGAVQAGLAFQVSQLFEPLLSELNLRNLLRLSALLSELSARKLDYGLFHWLHDECKSHEVNLAEEGQVGKRLRVFML